MMDLHKIISHKDIQTKLEERKRKRKKRERKETKTSKIKIHWNF